MAKLDNLNNIASTLSKEVKVHGAKYVGIMSELRETQTTIASLNLN